MVNHKVIRMTLALTIGVFLALFSYQRFTNEEPGGERAMEEAAVMASRDILRSYVAVDEVVEIVDPLAPSRVIGKVYIYPDERGWQLSGYYHRISNRTSSRGSRASVDRWHPYLMSLNDELELLTLSVKDSDELLKSLALTDSRFSVDPG